MSNLFPKFDTTVEGYNTKLSSRVVYEDRDDQGIALWHQELDGRAYDAHFDLTVEAEEKLLDLLQERKEARQAVVK